MLRLHRGVSLIGSLVIKAICHVREEKLQQSTWDSTALTNQSMTSENVKWMFPIRQMELLIMERASVGLWLWGGSWNTSANTFKDWNILYPLQTHAIKYEEEAVQCHITKYSILCVQSTLSHTGDTKLFILCSVCLGPCGCVKRENSPWVRDFKVKANEMAAFGSAIPLYSPFNYIWLEFPLRHPWAWDGVAAMLHLQTTCLNGNLQGMSQTFPQLIQTAAVLVV